MFWRSKDPKTGKMRLRSKNYQGTGTKADALKEARFLEGSDKHRPQTIEGDGTIAGFLAEWEKDAVQGLTPSSAYNIHWAVRKLSLWVGGTRMDKFSALTLANVRRQAISSGLQAVTARRVVRVFKSAMRDAIALNTLPADAMAYIVIAQKIRVKKNDAKLRTIEESELLAAELRPSHPDIADVVIVAAYTGMRFGEIAALSWEQVDLGQNKLKIDRTTSKGEDRATIIKMAPKTEAGRRTIPLAPEVVEVFTRRKLASDTDLIFPNKNGRPMNASSASVPVKKIAQRLGIAQGYHCSRHYWASLMIHRGVPLPIVSKLLGHKSVRVTMEEYAWCIEEPSENEAVLEALSIPNDPKTGSVRVARN